jgi:hypothetical protein
MATLLKSLLPTKEPTHTYYANADVISAKLEQPIERDIERQAVVELPTNGGYKYKPAEPLRVEGIISYRSGYTQVAGHPSSKLRGFTTLATSVVEDLNVLDVVTADRVVGQISTTHPVFGDGEGEGQVPSVTFLGTRFDNLRIGGHRVEVERSLDILGPKPEGDRSYFEDGGVFSRIAHQYANIKRVSDLPDWAGEEFNWDETEVQRQNRMKCSLVTGVSGAPGISFGHVIDVPHFGRIFLGELKVERERANGTSKADVPQPEKYKFHLNMIRLELGCLAKGTAKIVALDTNGSGGKGGGGGG